MASRLSAVILAAGLSSRMGELKAALPLGQGTVLEQCIKLFRGCGIEDVVVVTGHRSEETVAIAQRSGARIAHNPDFADGMYSSIRTGVGQLSDQNSGFFLLPVDIPLVRPGTLKLLTRSFTATPARITYPVFDGKRGHPPLIDRSLIPTIIEQKHPEGGLRTLLTTFETQHPQQIREVVVPDANILFDMDTPEDYFAGIERFARSDYPTSEECSLILRHIHPMPRKGLAHGQLVADIAVILGEAIEQLGKRELNTELCRVCGWLHDIAKGHAHHEREGGRWLRELGFDRAAKIVAAHKDLDWLPGEVVTEREIVHLADKVARGSRIVHLAERFEEKMVLYQDDPEAVRAIRRRYNQALQLAAAIEAEIGLELDVLLSALVPPCSH
jgi:molybdenum cofactor cytidylyltransferase